MSHTTERAPVLETPSSVHVPPQRPRRSLRQLLGWVAIVVGLVAAAVLLLLTITSDTNSRPTQSEPPPVTSFEDNVTRPEGVPGSADAAERYLANHNATRPKGAPWSADAAERYLANHNATRPKGAPWSADAAERYLANHH